MDLYAENILEHYRQPRGKIQNSEFRIQNGVKHEEKNPSCGDELTVCLKIENGVITDIAWEGTGCAISQAGMSMLAEDLIGKSAEEIALMKKDDMYALLGVAIGPRRFKCALLGLHTLKNAIRKSAKKAPQSWLETVEIDGQ